MSSHHSQEPLAGTPTSHHVHKHLGFFLAEEAILKGRGTITVLLSSRWHTRPWISPWNPKQVAKMPEVEHPRPMFPLSCHRGLYCPSLHMQGRQGAKPPSWGTSVERPKLASVRTPKAREHFLHRCAHPVPSSCYQACGSSSVWPWGHPGDHRACSHGFLDLKAERIAFCWTWVSDLETCCPVSRSG